MRKRVAVISFLLFIMLSLGTEVIAQCSVCTRTAQQLGEGPAKGLNAGIIYLAAVPFAIIGFLFYRWKRGR